MTEEATNIRTIRAAALVFPAWVAVASVPLLRAHPDAWSAS